MSTIRRWLSARARILGINRRNLDLVFAGYRPGRFRVLDDKMRTKEALEEAGVPVPATLDVLRSAADLPRLGRLLAEREELVLKPARGWGGRGILVLERRGGRWLQPNGAEWTREGLTSHVRDILSGVFSLDETEDAALVEERIAAHPFFANLCPEGLPDLRIVTRHGEPVQAMCRLPTRRSEGKANLHGGGVGAGIDLGTGELTGGVCLDRPVTRHPDTGVELPGLRIPGWDGCLELARRASRAVGFDYAGVDLVIDGRRGPLVLEVNARPGLAIQIANRSGQAVVPSASSRFDRFTLGAAFALFALLIVAPPIFDARESNRRSALQTIGSGAGPEATATLATPSETEAHAFGQEWDDEDVPVSALNESFGAARAAAAEGDTVRALDLYRMALGDESVAPFALNNMALIRRRAGDPEGALALLDEALSRYPSYSRGSYHRGLVLRDLGREDEAIAALGKALEIRPGHALSWAALGEIRFDRKEFAEAARAFEEAIRFDPASASYRTRAGLALRLVGDFDRAAELFHDVLRLDPGSEVAAYWWVRSVLDARAIPGGDEVADSELTAALEPHALAEDPSWRCAGLLGLLRREAGRTADALALFESVRKRHDPDEVYTRAAAETAFDLGLWNLAERRLGRPDDDDEEGTAIREWCAVGRFLDLPLREARSDPDAVAGVRATLRDASGDELRSHLLGRTDAEEWEPDPGAVPGALAEWIVYRLAEERGDGAGAAAALESLSRSTPDFYPRLRADFRAARTAGRDEDARRVAKRMLTLDSRDYELRLELARIELLAGHEARARAQLRRLPEPRRDLPDAKVVEAAILRAEGNPRESVSILKDVLRRSPEDVEARLELARGLSESGRARSATAELRAALDLAPGRTDVRETLARVLQSRKLYDEAAAEWRRVVQLDPAPSHRFNHALSLQRADRFEEAVAEYDLMIRDEPEDYRAWFNRALALEKLGRAEEAATGFRKVLELNPEHEASRQKLAKQEED